MTRVRGGSRAPRRRTRLAAGSRPGRARAPARAAPAGARRPGPPGRPPTRSRSRDPCPPRRGTGTRAGRCPAGSDGPGDARSRGARCRSPPTVAASSRWPDPSGGTGRDRLEGRGGHPGRQPRQLLRMAHLAEEMQQRQPRRHPVPAVERGRDRLGAVDRRAQGPARNRPAAGRARAERPAQTKPLLLGQHEQHREVPGGAADHGRGEADDALPAVGLRLGPGGHDEPLRVGRLEVGVQGHDRGQVVGDRRLVQPPGVVVDRDPPDRRAGHKLIRSGRPQVRLLGPPPDRHADRAPRHPGNSLHPVIRRVPRRPRPRSRAARPSRPARARPA